MKHLVFDFDGTITTRDTTRLLIYELLRLRPLKSPLIAFILAKLLLNRSPESIQTSKNRCIGELIKGLPHEAVESSLMRFSNKVMLLFRPELVKIIEDNLSLGNEVILASASPAFALKYLFSGYDLTIIATEFSKCGVFFTGSTVNGSCFGKNKANAVREYLELNAGSGVIECAWSDSISDFPVMMMAETRIWYCSAVDESLIREADPEGCLVICS
ncbi:MAG TPA: hypothetical protein DDY22_05765 [Geobacter sp.]|nr:hypothetical protein [Geobacter sp.]